MKFGDKQPVHGNVNSRHDESDNTEEKVLFPARYKMAVLGSMAIAIIYGNQASVSFALIAMVDHTAITSKNQTAASTNYLSTCEYKEEAGANGHSTATFDAEEVIDGPFVWDERMQGLILSAYSWGSIVVQIPAGRIAELMSPKWLLIGAVLLNVIGCLLSPIAAQVHYTFFIALRILEGMSNGIAFPAMHVMIAKWSPPIERNMFSTIIYTGSLIGVIIAMGISGGLIDYLGWKAIFYIQGPCPLIWCLVWWIYVEDSPEEQTRFITQSEKDHIERSLGITKRRSPEKKPPVPWRQIFRSIPFWAILVSHFCSNFAWTLILTHMPSFMTRVLEFTAFRTSMLLAVSYLCLWIFSIVVGKMLIHLVYKGQITTSTSRKTAMLIATVIPMICFIGVGYVECNRTLVTFILVIAIISTGGVFSGYVINHIDIAPDFAGSLLGISSTVASIAGFITPIIVANMLQDNYTVEAWRRILFLVAGILAIDVFNFVTFSSTDIQPWNDAGDGREVNNDKELLEKSPQKCETIALKNDEETSLITRVQESIEN